MRLIVIGTKKRFNPLICRCSSELRPITNQGFVEALLFEYLALHY